MVDAPSLLFSSFSLPPLLPSMSFIHEEERGYKTQYIRSYSAMYDGHWNIMSQIRVPQRTIPGESIPDISETKMVARSSLSNWVHDTPLQ